jgi:hypothetical protein
MSLFYIMPRGTSKYNRKSKLTKKRALKKMGGGSSADYVQFVYGGPGQQLPIGNGSNEIAILNDPSKYGISQPHVVPIVGGGSAAQYTEFVYGNDQKPIADRGNEIGLANDPSAYVGGDVVSGVETEKEKESVDEQPVFPTVSTPEPVAPAPDATQNAWQFPDIFGPETTTPENAEKETTTPVVAAPVVVTAPNTTQHGGKSKKMAATIPALLLYANPFYKSKKNRKHKKHGNKTNKKGRK